MTDIIEKTEPHPYLLGMHDGQWHAHGCKDCHEKPGAEIHNPLLWDDPPLEPK